MNGRKALMHVAVIHMMTVCRAVMFAFRFRCFAFAFAWGRQEENDRERVGDGIGVSCVLTLKLVHCTNLFRKRM